jgi:hypothetical protein
MKKALRLAQSQERQPFEQMGFFDRFSSRPRADLACRKKLDFGLISDPPGASFFGLGRSILAPNSSAPGAW